MNKQKERARTPPLPPAIPRTFTNPGDEGGGVPPPVYTKTVKLQWKTGLF